MISPFTYLSHPAVCTHKHAFLMVVMGRTLECQRQDKKRNIYYCQKINYGEATPSLHLTPMYI